MYHFFDTETNGFPSDGLPPDHPNQAQIVQIGSMVMDENQRVVSELNVLIKPDGWIISDRLVEIHGISTALCEQFGMPLCSAMAIFHHHVKISRLAVAHNMPFDHGMFRLAYARVNAIDNFTDFAKRDSYCTMRETTDFCKLPKARGTGFKWPKLTEVYQIMFGKELNCAHDAMADVRGCAEVYFEWQRRKSLKMGAGSDVIITDSPL